MRLITSVCCLYVLNVFTFLALNINVAKAEEADYSNQDHQEPALLEHQTSTTQLYKLTFSKRATHMHQVGSSDVRVVDRDALGTQSVTFSPCGNYLVTGVHSTPGYGSTRLYLITPETQLIPCVETDYDSGTHGTLCTAFSPCGHYLAVGLSRGSKVGSTRIYQVSKSDRHDSVMLSLVAFADGDELDATLGQPTTWCTSSLAFSPCGRYLITGINKTHTPSSSRGSTKLYMLDFSQPTPERRLRLLCVTDQDALSTNVIAISPCGNYVATGIARDRGTSGATTRLYRLNRTDGATPLTLVASFDADSARQGTQTLAFSPNGDFLATGIDARSTSNPGNTRTTRIYFVRPAWLASRHAPHLVACTEESIRQVHVLTFNQEGNSLIAGITDAEGQHQTLFYAFDPSIIDGPQRLTIKGRTENQRWPTVALALTRKDNLFALGQKEPLLELPF